MSTVSQQLRTSIGALLILIGVGGGAYVVTEEARKEAIRNEYVQAVAADQDVSTAVKIAMVMASFYESSNRHVGKPYVDKLGKGQPLTVCNGITGLDVIAGKYYAPAACYWLEKTRYLRYERVAGNLLSDWDSYDPFVQATFLDFLHNKGEGNFRSSTMLRKANAGDLQGACAENPRWNRGTVNGISTVLPGLKVRGDSNAEICADWRLP